MPQTHTKTGLDLLEFQYLLELNLGYSPEAERWVQGFLKVNLHGSKSEITDIDLTQE